MARPSVSHAAPLAGPLAVDAAGEDPAAAWRTVREEIGRYGAGLGDKPEVLALSRSDLVDADQLEDAKAALKESGAPDPIVISAATGEGMDQLLDRIIEQLGPEAEAAELEEEQGGRGWSPL